MGFGMSFPAPTSEQRGQMKKDYEAFIRKITGGASSIISEAEDRAVRRKYAREVLGPTGLDIPKLKFIRMR
jgi:hypothetical protein